MSYLVTKDGEILGFTVSGPASLRLSNGMEVPDRGQHTLFASLESAACWSAALIMLGDVRAADFHKLWRDQMDRGRLEHAKL